MEHMLTVVVSIVTWAVTGALGALVGFFATKLHSRTKHEEAMEEGMRCLLRKEIVDMYDLYVHERHPMSVERKRDVVEAYEAYHALGGNGVITDMYQELVETDVYIVR